MQSLSLSPDYTLNSIYGQIQINFKVLGMEPKLIPNACPARLKGIQEYLFRLQLFPTCFFILLLLGHRTIVSRLLCHFPLHAWTELVFFLLFFFFTFPPLICLVIVYCGIISEKYYFQENDKTTKPWSGPHLIWSCCCNEFFRIFKSWCYCRR